MKYVMIILFVFFCGCNQLSPRFKNEIDNQNGKIGTLENLANSIKADVGNLQAQNDIQNSQLEKIQQGLLNWQNNGIQIFSGSGGLFFGFMGFLAILAFHYRSKSKLHEKSADIMAQRIVESKNPELQDAVFQAAMFTNTEETILRLIKKHQTS